MMFHQKLWLDRLHLAGSRVLVFVHGFADDAEKVIQRHLAIKRQLLSGMSPSSVSIGRQETLSSIHT